MATRNPFSKSTIAVAWKSQRGTQSAEWRMESGEWRAETEPGEELIENDKPQAGYID